MNNFSRGYQEAMSSIVIPEITVETVLNEARHRQSMHIKLYRQIMVVATALCICFIGAAGTATAVNYTKSFIGVNKFGFTTSTSKESNGLADLLNIDLSDYGISSKEDVEVLDMTIMASETFHSLDAVYVAYPDIILAMPNFSCVTEAITEETYVIFNKSKIDASVICGEKYFEIVQTDFGNSTSHYSSIMYSSEVCNERNYTTKQGFTYKLVDSVYEEEQPFRIHAVISINNYEIVVEFMDYSEEEAYQILESMDMNIYIR